MNRTSDDALKTVETRNGRDEVVDYLHRALVGPAGGEEETIDGTPLLRYMMGILFPRGTSADALRDRVGAGADDPLPAVGKDGEEETGEAGSDASHDQLPSALSVSFLVSPSATLECDVRAGQYGEEVAGTPSEASKSRRRSSKIWRRRQLGDLSPRASLVLTPSRTQCDVLGGVGKLRSIWRQRDDGWLVTVTLENEQDGGAFDVEKCLFQCELSCRVLGGHVLPYPVPRSFADLDRTEEQYLYRESMPYARGHGCAADWRVSNERVTEVRASFLPTVDVPQPEFKLPEDVGDLDRRVFEVGFLASIREHTDEVIGALVSFAAAYERWIERERALAAGEGELEAGRLADVVARWAARIRKGIELLATDRIARSAFADANRAMGYQMLLSSHLRRLADAGRNIAPDEPVALPDIGNLAGHGWRPFQLAFALGLLESLWSEHSTERAEVDIIWFPTGGGKTEAYLLVSAFELLRRRLVAKERDSATAILSRYTLRMLTAQQFQRTAALFVALEEVRRANEADYGSRRFTLGLWVGDGMTPNAFGNAQEKLDDFVERKGEGANPFLIDRCPRCGTSIFHPSVDAKRQWGAIATASEFRISCPRRACSFHASGLPVQLIDQDLYRNPPSMLIGTVDKFANLAWSEAAASFFGGSDPRCLGPSLLIQDELHLISGPLGTLDAMYEAAIEGIILARKGVRPKIIGSTATIRNAADQVRGLYARPCTVFPSPIRRWDDAFFYRRNPARTRRYVGVMPQGYVRPVIALVWTSAALLQATNDDRVAMTESERDAYWTLVAYHNSRRELGRTMTAARDEIQARVGVLARAEDAVRRIERVMQLSANGPVSIDQAIRLMEAARTSDGGALDLVPCTNILSVGIDINRLGLMLVNGQPKLVAEYIQATSRVGRGSVDGLVVTLFSPNKARDRSHYEDFRSFHENMYRYVEPTSVTPLSPPARKRTLHAALIAIVRHSTPWGSNDGARAVDFADDRFKAILRDLSSRARNMMSDGAEEEAAVERELAAFVDSWQDQQKPSLVYDQTSLGPQFDGLIKGYGESRGRGVPTMRSMRHVDTEIQLRVVSERFQ